MSCFGSGGRGRKARGGEGTGSEEGGAGEANEGPTTEFVSGKVGDLISTLEAEMEGPHASNSAALESQHLVPHDSPSPSLTSPSKF